MHRRRFLLALPFAWAAHAQNRPLPLASPVDAAHVYIVPTDDISEETAGSIARALSSESGLWIKSTLWTPVDGLEPFAGTNQYAAEDFFPIPQRLSRVLRDVSPRTYFIVLTTRDINARSRNFRFQYSYHSPMTNTSVLSVARLRYQIDGTPAPVDLVVSRVTKMLMRIVGEMRMGWKRNGDPADLMYAPIMSVEDIDRMNLSHTIRSRKEAL